MIGVSISPQLIHLSRSGQLAKSIADENRTGNFFAKEIPAVRQDRSYPRSHVVTANDRAVTDAYSGHVGDGIEWPGRQDTHDYAGLARTRPPGILCLRHCLCH